MLKTYIIEYLVPQQAAKGVAVVVAETIQSSQKILQTQGKYNAFKYEVRETILINDTDKYNASAILKEISLSYSGDY